jgi:SRSO17 transposase
VPASLTTDLGAWRAEFDVAFARVAGRFAQACSRKRARAYLLGLLSRCERKNGWTIAELAGDGTPDGLQRLLNFYSQSADDVRDDLRDYVAPELGWSGWRRRHQARACKSRHQQRQRSAALKRRPATSAAAILNRAGSGARR